MTSSMPGGAWSGYYQYDGDRKRHAMSLVFASDGAEFTATGSDDAGPFSLRGAAADASGRVQWHKVYDAGTHVLYQGIWDPAQRTIVGRWSLLDASVKGRFGLAPGAEVSFEAFAPVRRSLSAAPALEQLKTARSRWFRSELAKVEALRHLDVVDYFDSSVAQHRRSLLANGLRLTAATSPGVFAMVERCKARLALDAAVDVYCVSMPEIQAFAVPSTDARILVGLSGTALNELGDEELAFVLGHEIGHVCLQHAEIPQPELLEQHDIPSLAMLKVAAWMRYAELEADRLGLLCCDGIAAARSALLKLTMGVSSTRVQLGAVDVDSIVADLRADVVHEEQDDWVSSHPFLPLRAYLLERFAQLATGPLLLVPAAEKLGWLPAAAAAELDRVTEETMRIMEPGYLFEPAKGEAATRRFLEAALLHLALLDDKVTPAEAVALAVRFGAESVGLTTSQLMDRTYRGHQLGLWSQVVVREEPLARRKVLLHDLALFATATGQTRAQVLQPLAMLLGLDIELEGLQALMQPRKLD